MTKPAFERIMTGLEEALAHSRGDEVPGLRVYVPESIDVGSVRARTGLSQAAFAGQIGVPVATLRNWEQGRRAPDGPARVLLAMLERNPQIVRDTLGTN